VGLGAFVGIGGLPHLARLGIRVPMALGRPLDAVGVVQPRVEPLGAVRGRHLLREHGAQFGLEGLRILDVVEVPMLLAPVAPAARHAVKDLSRVRLTSEAAVGLGDPAPTEVLLGEDIHGDLGPGLGRHDALGAEDDAPIRVAYLAGAGDKVHPLIRGMARLGEATRELQGGTSALCKLLAVMLYTSVIARRGVYRPPPPHVKGNTHNIE